MLGVDGGVSVGVGGGGEIVISVTMCSPHTSYVSDATVALCVVFLLFVVPSQPCCRLFRHGSVGPGRCGQ